MTFCLNLRTVELVLAILPVVQTESILTSVSNIRSQMWEIIKITIQTLKTRFSVFYGSCSLKYSSLFWVKITSFSSIYLFIWNQYCQFVHMFRHRRAHITKSIGRNFAVGSMRVAVHLCETWCTSIQTCLKTICLSTASLFFASDVARVLTSWHMNSHDKNSANCSCLS
jgi:hypothetical protein